MVSVSQLRDARFEVLEAAAREWQKAFPELRSCAGRYETDVLRPRAIAEWEGPSGAQARNELAKAGLQIQRAAGVAEAVGRAISDAFAGFRQAQTALVAVLQEIQDRNARRNRDVDPEFSVGEDGAVKWVLPPQALQALSAAAATGGGAAAGQMDAVYGGYAQEYADRIRRALAQADECDQRSMRDLREDYEYEIGHRAAFKPNPTVGPPGQVYDTLLQVFVGEMRNNALSPEVRAMSFAYSPDGWVENLGALGLTVATGGASNPITNKLAALAAFAEKVRPGGVWDHKPMLAEKYGMTQGDAQWITIPGRPDLQIFSDVWSNIHYGYVGREAGFEQKVLLTGQNLPGTGAHDKGDDLTVRIGMDLHDRKGPKDLTQDDLNKIILEHVDDLTAQGKVRVIPGPGSR